MVLLPNRLLLVYGGGGGGGGEVYVFLKIKGPKNLGKNTFSEFFDLNG